MTNLADKRCVAYAAGTPALSPEQQRHLGQQIPEWENLDGKRIKRIYKFKSYLEGVAWVQQAALIADQEDHHPDIHLFWRKVVVEFWTHTVKGLSENDYILAAKFDRLFSSL